MGFMHTCMVHWASIAKNCTGINNIFEERQDFPHYFISEFRCMHVGMYVHKVMINAMVTATEYYRC